jgi:hypothetical protein
VNTELFYVYRDACNYKFRNSVIVGGVLEPAQIECFLREKVFFIPSEVGLSDLQPEPSTVDDHIWHEIEAIELTNDEPNVEMQASSLVRLFRMASAKNWNEFSVFKRKGLI